jgi:hypothetical protein
LPRNVIHPTFTPALGLNQPPLKRVRGELFQVISGQVVKINTKLYLVVRISEMKI